MCKMPPPPVLPSEVVVALAGPDRQPGVGVQGEHLGPGKGYEGAEPGAGA